MTEHTTLPPKPQAPIDYDCCGGGCADCELRLYQRALAEWMRLEAATREQAPEPGRR